MNRTVLLAAALMCLVPVQWIAMPAGARWAIEYGRESMPDIGPTAWTATVQDAFGDTYRFAIASPGRVGPLGRLSIRYGDLGFVELRGFG